MVTNNLTKYVIIMNPKFIRIEFSNLNNELVAIHTLEGCGFMMATEYANRLIREFPLILRAVFVLPKY